VNFAKRLFVDHLLDLSELGEAHASSPQSADRLRRILLLLTSHIPEHCKLARLIEYSSCPVDSEIHEQGVLGLKVTGDGPAIPDVVAGLARVESVPEAVTEWAGPVHIDEFRASLMLIDALLHSIEWSSNDHAYPDVSPDKVGAAHGLISSRSELPV